MYFVCPGTATSVLRERDSAKNIHGNPSRKSSAVPTEKQTLETLFPNNLVILRDFVFQKFTYANIRFDFGLTANATSYEVIV